MFTSIFEVVFADTAACCDTYLICDDIPEEGLQALPVVVKLVVYEEKIKKDGTSRPRAPHPACRPERTSRLPAVQTPLAFVRKRFF